MSVLGTLYDLRRFCVGLRASFVGLREPSIGQMNSHLVILCQPESTLFRSERVLFDTGGSSVGLRRPSVGLKVRFYWPEIAIFRSNMPRIGLRGPSVGLGGPSVGLKGFCAQSEVRAAESATF